VAEDGDLVIPIHLCSEDGRIVVNRTDSPSVVIQRGVVQIVNQNETYGCDDPITDGDPTNEDAVVYRPTLATDALENGFVTGVNANFVGNAHDFQNGCVNPSRGSGGKGSYFIDRLRIHFGSEEPAFVQAQMELLQGDKLRVLQAAVNAARPALRRVDWLALRVLTDAAIFLHGRGNYAAALFKIRVLLALNDRVRYAVILGQNPNGEIKYRALNIEDMYRRRIIPLAP
jgi:hypothetical protein